MCWTAVELKQKYLQWGQYVGYLGVALLLLLDLIKAVQSLKHKNVSSWIFNKEF